MTNIEIISEASEEIGFEYDGDNLKTYKEWKKEGYHVKKGEHAILKCDLWTVTKLSKKERELEEEKAKKEGRKPNLSKFRLKASHLFSDKQVEKNVKH